MCSAAAEHGLSLANCLQGSGIAPSALEDPSADVYPKQELAVIDNIVRQLAGAPALGLEVGSRIHISAYGVYAFALATCANLRELLDLGMRYSQLSFSLTDKVFEVRSGDIHATLDDSHIPEHLRMFVLERDVAGLFNALNELFSARPPVRRAQVRYARPPWAELYRQRFGVDVEFGASQNVVVIDGQWLDAPLPQANDRALRFWEAHLAELLANKRARAGLAGRVRSILSRNPGIAPNMEAIARELNTTSRQLRRLLTVEGTSFRNLVDELRETLAEELLTSGRLTIEQVADRLGYNEVSSFSNAFKRWKGQSPNQWRQRQRTGLVRVKTSLGS
jgi:AraC-like DNA-binding protein